MASPIWRTWGSSDVDPYSPAPVYYAEAIQETRKHHRSHSFNAGVAPNTFRAGIKRLPNRRGSYDEDSLAKRTFLIDVEHTYKYLQAQEDTDGNHQITVEDRGPKVFHVGTLGSDGYQHVDVRGTYMLSNLLQELSLARSYGRRTIVLDEARLSENPVHRLARLIAHEFWDGLARRIDGSNIEIAARDPKDWTDDPRPRIYVPVGAPEQHAYYLQIASDRPELGLDVQWLPNPITPQAVRALNSCPGMLALDMETVKEKVTGKTTMSGVPFVVPGGRLNEQYGWDSYMESLGLLINGKVHLAKGMVQNFCFSIKHYGKILNANRSYYLCRSQPPFLTDMALRVYAHIKHEPGSREFMRTSILAAIKEYHSVWVAWPRYDEETGLSRYRPEGMGVPPETEALHFAHVFEPFGKKYSMTFQEIVNAYNTEQIQEPELDEYFLHDRAVRESGHDTSYRLEKVCANLATIDLNALLYKYETDIAGAIRDLFMDGLRVPAEFCVGDQVPNHIESSSIWIRRARQRKAAITKYLWNEEKGMFFDYDTIKKEQCTYESCTTFWAMWSGAATPAQAARMVSTAIPLFEADGGLTSGTERSLAASGPDRLDRQWDYPYGWAPHQILAWTGLQRYAFNETAERLAYKWLYMMTKAFVDFSGVVVEKYDVTRITDPHRVSAEYGNQGLNFKGVAREGFGWVNASYVYGLQIINVHMQRALGTLAPWTQYNRAIDTHLP